MNATATAAPIATGSVVRYKRDGAFTVVRHLEDGRTVITTDKGKFAGKERTVTLGADTIVVTPAVPHTRAECEDLDTCHVDHTPEAPAVVETPAPTRTRRPRTAAAAPRAPRADLPEGWVTTTQLAAIINERGLYRGSLDALPPRFLNRRIIEAGVRNPFPGEKVDGRYAVEVEAGVAWFVNGQRGA